MKAKKILAKKRSAETKASKVKVPTPPHERTFRKKQGPDFEQLSDQAAENLARLRKDLTKEVEDRYLTAKRAEVERLAHEVGYTRLIILDITRDEEKAFEVALP